MNDLEKKRILELKEAGYGYGSIAKQLGISKSTISSFLKSLSGYSVCKCCGKKFIQPAGVRAKVFCCDKYRRIQAKGKPLVTGCEVECLCCHKRFYSYRSLKRKFCSRYCFENFRKGGGNDEAK